MQWTAFGLISLLLTPPANAQARPTLTLYSSVGYAKNVTEAFTKATGIPVKLVELSTGPLLARVQAEKQNPQWEMLWTEGAEPMRDLASQGQLQMGWKPKASWNTLGRRLLPGDLAYIPATTSLTGMFVVNTKVVPADKVPQSWADLNRPDLKGLVGMTNPAVSGPSYTSIAGLMTVAGGIQNGKNALTTLKKNGMQVFDSGGPLIKQLSAGGLGVAVTQSTRYVAALLDKQPVAAVYPKGTALLPTVFGISRRAKPDVQDAAHQLIEFFLTPAGQKFALESGNSASYYYPLVKGVSANPLVTPIEKTSFMQVDPKSWGPREGAINRPPAKVSW